MAKTRGVVAAGSRLTAQAGAMMLEEGGNAFDAVVASTFMSFIAESTLSTLGGSGFATLYEASERRCLLLDFFSVMPHGKVGRTDLDFHQVVCGYGSAGAEEKVYVGRASSAVPGNPIGLLELHKKRGRMPLSEVVYPAVEACRKGIELTCEQAKNNLSYRSVVRRTEEMRRFYMEGDDMRPAGSRMVLPELGDTIEALAVEGERFFREGELGRRLVEDHREKGGLITRRDLMEYKVELREPLTFERQGRVYFTNPPPSLGGSLLRISCLLADKVGLIGLPFLSGTELERLAEVMRWTELMRKEKNDDARALASVGDEEITSLADRLTISLGVSASERPIASSLKISPSTTHISVMDGKGNAVALTTSPGYLAGYFVPGTGMSMNNMLGEPDLNPRGFHRAEPGSRVVSMMSPTLIFEQGRPVMAIGSGGGSRLRGAIFQTMLRFWGNGLPLDKAVESPRIHLADEVLHVEPGVPGNAIAWLEERGFCVNRFELPDLYFGGTHTVCSMKGYFVGAGDPRREGTALVV